MDRDQKLSASEMLSFFAVGPSYGNVYVLGCFARYVTLYSQQVRALNLVSALLETKVIKPGSSLIVIGGGAAGLTVSAAAALAGADVTVLEALEDPLELQMNNRQRWIHPRIYDWPESDLEKEKNDRAGLPVLDWKAGYAETVGDMILDDWKKIAAHTKRIHFKGQVTETSILLSSRQVSWNQPGHNGQRSRSDSTVILAVGFGLDGDKTGHGSYWADDDLDNSLQSVKGQKVLVVGHGDGALTDVMRLCFRRFRHAQITELFRGSDDIGGIKRDLLEIHNQAAKLPPLANVAEFIHNGFDGLERHGLEEVLSSRIRENRPTIYLTGNDQYYLGPTASILNRLILLLLIKQKADVVKPISGPASLAPEDLKGKWRVKVGDAVKEYDRIVYRTGPAKAIADFSAVLDQCGNLQAKWKHLNQFNDPTRREATWDYLKGLWPLGKLSPFKETGIVQTLGVSAQAMSVSKEIRSDGSSTLAYSILDLRVFRGEIEGIRCLFSFSAGCLGPPELDMASALQAGATWHSDPPPQAEPSTLSEQMELARARARQISGVIRFEPPLTPDSPPASIGLRFTVLNGDALSSWEFEQLYSDDDRKHVNQMEAIENREYFARTIMIPVESLQLRLTLPERIGAPFLSAFQCTKPGKITAGTITPQNLLQLVPFSDSPLHFSKVLWERIPVASLPLSRPTPRTWEVSIDRPPVGTVYSLDFDVPSLELSGDRQILALQSQGFRRKLLEYAAIRRKNGLLDARGDAIRAQVLGVARALAYWFAQGSEQELFQVTVMTYDESQRRLIMVDGADNGSESHPSLWDFWLPFGLGLAGACFKQADRPWVYIKPHPGTRRTGPDIYVPPRKGGNGQDVLISVPIDHPDYETDFEMERSRQCLAVVSFGSDNPSDKFRALSEGSSLNDVVGVCRYFGDNLFRLVSEK